MNEFGDRVIIYLGKEVSFKPGRQRHGTKDREERGNETLVGMECVGKHGMSCRLTECFLRRSMTCATDDIFPNIEVYHLEVEEKGPRVRIDA